MNRFFVLLVSLCLLLAGCRSSRSSVSHQSLVARQSSVQVTDSQSLSLSSHLERLLGEGELTARIIRFYPAVPDSLPSPTPLPDLASTSGQQPFPPVFPTFGSVKSITDITLHGRSLQESVSASGTMVNKSDTTQTESDVNSSASASSEVKPSSYPWYKYLIIFGIEVLVCGTIALILSRCRIRNINS